MIVEVYMIIETYPTSIFLQINHSPLEPNRHRVVYLCLHLLRFIFWAYFIEFMLHFMYFNALQNSVEALQRVPLFTLAGLGYCHGQFFMMKYFVMFGYPGTVAKFDNLDPPAPPKCITYIYLYSDMWKWVIKVYSLPTTTPTFHPNKKMNKYTFTTQQNLQLSASL